MYILNFYVTPIIRSITRIIDLPNNDFLRVVNVLCSCWSKLWSFRFHLWLVGFWLLHIFWNNECHSLSYTANREIIFKNQLRLGVVPNLTSAFSAVVVPLRSHDLYITVPQVLDMILPWNERPWYLSNFLETLYPHPAPQPHCNPIFLAIRFLPIFLT